jgi:hypothetical protein
MDIDLQSIYFNISNTFSFNKYPFTALRAQLGFSY